MITSFRIRSAMNNYYVIPDISGPVVGGTIGFNNPDTGNASNPNWPPSTKTFNLYAATPDGQHQLKSRDQIIWTAVTSATPTIASSLSENYTDTPTILYSPYYYGFLNLTPSGPYNPYEDAIFLPSVDQNINSTNALKIVIKNNINGHTIHKYDETSVYGDALFFDDTAPNSPLKFLPVTGPAIDNFIWNIETVYSS